MRCLFCKHSETIVVDSRVPEETDTVKRRRCCQACGRRFTTYEYAERSMPRVVKKNGYRAEYEHTKLVNSMRLALRKRPITAEALEQGVINIEEKLLGSKAKEISSVALGEFVMQELKILDKIAYIRFVSVYKSFEDLTQFNAILQALTESA